jgi:transcriptional regulator with XRE-family HTH domain
VEKYRRERRSMYVQLDADTVRSLREDRGLTRSEFAQLSGVPEGTLEKVERGVRPVRAKTARRVVAALGVPRELVGRPLI